MPSLTLIAGANGSGKSTFVRALSLDFIDPDRIAAGYGEGFTPPANLRASRETLRLIEQQLQSQQDLTLEVTLASSQPLHLIEAATTSLMTCWSAVDHASWPIFLKRWRWQT